MTQEQKDKVIDPRTIGYWAADKGLTLSHLLSTNKHPDLIGKLAEAEAQHEFLAGWQEREDERLDEQLNDLFFKLGMIALEHTEPGSDGQSGGVARERKASTPTL